MFTSKYWSVLMTVEIGTDAENVEMVETGLGLVSLVPGTSANPATARVPAFTEVAPLEFP